MAPEVTVGTAHPQPPAVWLELCVVVAVFVASAEDVAVFDCDTVPSLPGLSTRTEMFWFDGWICVALEAAAAVWSVDDDWVDDWTGSASALPHVTASTASATTSVVINRLMCENSFDIAGTTRDSARSTGAPHYPGRVFMSSTRSRGLR
jgi:hypothetical protein